VHNVDFPLALAWAPDGRLFFAERGGRIEVTNGRQSAVFATVSTMTTEPDGSSSERGLLGLALAPTFAADHFVYVAYSTADHTHTVVARFTDCGGKGVDAKALLTFPSGDDCCHKGGRLAFGPDGKLYVSLGDEHSVPAPPDGPNPPVPQATGDPRGKILRYNPDGSIPADNPFGAGSAVWVAGLRNPFGLAFGAGGTLFVTGNGPTGDAGSPSTGYDLAFVAAKGEIGQWPYCYGYGHPVKPYPSCHGRPAPDWSSEKSTVVPTGATYVDDNGPAGTRGHFVFCTTNNGMLIFTAGSPHATVSAGNPYCLLDVKQGPDHALYFTDASNIYRLG
jgi:glucose/arabinose dehydrogenase